MDEQEIIAALSTRKAGQIFHVSMRRPAKVRKGVANVITKASKFSCQLTGYASRGPVREAVESGERLAPETPAWVAETKIVEGVRFWSHGNGQQYLATPVIKTNKPQWEKDGQEVALSEIQALLLASELADKPSKEELEEKGQVRFVAVKLENILSIS